VSSTAVIKSNNPFSSGAEFTEGIANSKSDNEWVIPSMTRRPTRGLLLSSDTPASLSIRTTTGGEAWLLKNSSLPDTGGYSPDKAWFTTNFMLQAVSVSRNEKFQEIETFGPTYGFFFGERPIMITAQALLLSTPDFPWVEEWWWNYAHGLSGTKLTEANSRVYLEYNDMILEGYILNCQLGETADNPNSVNLTFTMWVTQIDYKIDPGHLYPQGSGTDPLYEDENVQATASAGGATSTSNEVRAANIRALLGMGGEMQGRTGLAAMRYLSGEVRNFVGTLGGLTELASVFLLGRQVVLPAGYLGAEIYSGAAEFASGTLTEDQLKTLQGAGVSPTQVRLPPEFTANKDAFKRRSSQPFYKNTDEYPFALTGGPPTTATGIDEATKDAFDISRAAGVGVVTQGFAVPISAKGVRDEVDLYALGQFKKAGLTRLYPSITNFEGGSFPEWAVALGRVAYGGVLLAGSELTSATYGRTPYDSSSSLPNAEGPSTVNLQREAVPPLQLNPTVTGDLLPPTVVAASVG